MVKQFGHIAKWKLNLLLILFLFAILILVSGCQTTKQVPQITITVPFAGDYPVLKLRQLWGFCLAQFQATKSYVHPQIISQMCDCYVDEIRKTHTAKDIKKLTENASRKMGQQLIRACNVIADDLKNIGTL